MNLTDWNFSIQKVSWIDEGFVTSVWVWGSKMVGSCPHSPRGSPVAQQQKHTGPPPAHFCEADTTQIKTLTSCLQLHRGLTILGPGYLVLSLCCPHGSRDVQGPGMHREALTCYQGAVCGGHLPLHSQHCKGLGGNIWGCVSSCCSHHWNICQLQMMMGQGQVLTGTSRCIIC